MKRIGFTALSIAAMAATSLAVAQSPAVQIPAAKSPAIKATPAASASKSEEVAPTAQPTPVVEAATTEAPVARAMAIQIAPADDKAPAANQADQKPEIVEAPKPPAPPAITLVAKVDLAMQKVTVFEHGKAKHTWTISSGTRGFETPRGTFQPGWMAKMWYSKQYDNSPMPHSVFFKDGAAFHATQWTGQLGRPASHGCVRLTPANAAKFYALVSSHGMKHTRISVFGTPRHAPERQAPDMVASRRAPQYGGQRVATYNGGYSNGYNSYAGNYSNGSAFMAKQIPYRPQPVQVRVVQYGSRGSRY